MKLSEYIKQYRDKHNLSLRQMAERCDCSFQYISKLEKDEIEVPTAKMLKKLATGMNMSLHELLTSVDDLIMYYDISHFVEPDSYVVIENQDVTNAYSNADERIKKMVRMLLGLDE